MQTKILNLTQQEQFFTNKSSTMSFVEMQQQQYNQRMHMKQSAFNRQQQHQLPNVKNHHTFNLVNSNSSSMSNLSSIDMMQMKQQQMVNAANNASTSQASRYKTELCRSYQENGSCKYGDKCQFAHGENEMRNMNRHPKYKTELCRTFHASGYCPYGPRCHFVHDNTAELMPNNMDQPDETGNLLLATNVELFNSYLPLYTNAVPNVRAENATSNLLMLANRSSSVSSSSSSITPQSSRSLSPDNHVASAGLQPLTFQFNSLNLASTASQNSSPSSTSTSSPSSSSTNLSRFSFASNDFLYNLLN